jgi:hypothetical protein
VALWRAPNDGTTLAGDDRMHTIVLLTGSLLAAVPVPPAAPKDAPIATAPPVAEPAAPAAAEPDVWYGDSAAVADGVALSLIFGGFGLSGTKANGFAGPAAFTGVIGFEFVGPLSHLSHGHGGVAAASLGLRLVATTVSGYFFLNAVIDRCNADNGTDTPGCNKLSFSQAASIGVPFLAAAAIDDFALAHGTVPPPRSARVGPTVTPGIGPGWAMLSVAGRF